MAQPSHWKRLDRALDELGDIPDPLLRLDALRQAREALERLELEALRDSRRSGATWKDIGALYGLTKQGAQQRFRATRNAEPTQQHPAP